MNDIAPIFGRTFISLRTADVIVWMSARPHYCDRGRVMVNVVSHNILKVDVDAADGFPRYYFSIERAKAEMADWLAARGQVVTRDWIEEDCESFNP